MHVWFNNTSAFMNKTSSLSLFRAAATHWDSRKVPEFTLWVVCLDKMHKLPEGRSLFQTFNTL